MVRWLHATLVWASVLILVLVVLVILKQFFWPKTRKYLDAVDAERGQSLQNGITRLHQVSPHHHHHPDRDGSMKSNQYNLFSQTESTFRWRDHPSLIEEAVENGWPRFAFTVLVSPSPSVKSIRSVFGHCTNPGNESRVEIGWEVCQGSADFMQKVRLNPESKKNATSLLCVRAALPLPGPNLGNSSFPQEAYFEITILPWNGSGCDRVPSNKGKPGDIIKLVREDFNAKNSTDDSLSDHVRSSHTKIEQVKLGKHGKGNGGILLSVGLTVTQAGRGPVELQLPGSYPGSVGFSSNGSVYLNGTKLVYESNKDEWGRSGNIVGCGYNPSQKKVLFTVNSQLVHEIYCKTEEFSSPLYPVLAANDDLSVSVNLGQKPFTFAPANLQRTSNPCFICPLATSASSGYEDSKELFSIGRIDSQWKRSNTNTVTSIKDIYDQESDGDFFEIVLERIGTSPHTTTFQ